MLEDGDGEFGSDDDEDGDGQEESMAVVNSDEGGSLTLSITIMA